MQQHPEPAEVENGYVAPKLEDHGRVEIVTKGEEEGKKPEEHDAALVWGNIPPMPMD